MAEPFDLLMLSGDTQLATGRRGVFFGVLEELSRHFDRIDVVSPRPAGPVTTRTLFGNVLLHPASCGRFGQVGHIVRTARALFAERRWRLATSHDYGTFYNGRAALRLRRELGLPFLSEIHHVPGHPRAACARERLEYLLCRCWVRRARDAAAAFRVVNRVEAPELLRRFGVPKERIRVIPSLYLDTEVFSPAPRDPDCDVLAVGRLVPNKRFDLVLRASALLSRRGRPVRVRLIGEGPLEARLLALAERLGIGGRLRHDRFLEGPEALAEAYRRARVLVCASASEGGPRVTCEAMACGTPVVTTPVGLMRELVRDGETGLVFHWRADELADRIARLLDDEGFARRLGRAGREVVLPFERRRMLRNYAEELRRIAEEAA